MIEMWEMELELVELARQGLSGPGQSILQGMIINERQVRDVVSDA